MEQWIYEQSKIVGSFESVPQGLYYEVSCRLEQGMGIRRLYAVNGFQSEYIGIPDASGMLKRKIKKKLLPNGIDSVITSQRERSSWSPWRGDLDGIAVENAEICRDGEELVLALSPTEALRFPAWVNCFTLEKIDNQSRMLIRLTSDGRPAALETENGRDTNEEIDSDLVDFGMPSEPVSFDGDSLGEHREEADCPNL